NMVLERHTDALMRRTARRPLPAGRLRVIEALVFGLALTSAGLTSLLWISGRWPAALALLTWASYLFIYTPLKTRTSLCTVAVAFPGALPPVIGRPAAWRDGSSSSARSSWASPSPRSRWLPRCGARMGQPGPCSAPPSCILRRYAYCSSSRGISVATAAPARSALGGRPRVADGVR